MFKSVILALGLGLAANSASAVTLYQETFTGQDGKGITGTSALDLTGVSWAIESSTASLTASSDYLQVVSEAFSIRDTDGTGVCASPTCTLPSWSSPSIDVTSATNLFFSMTYTFSSAIFEASGSGQDDFVVTVIEDGAPRLLQDLLTTDGTQTSGALTGISISATNSVQFRIFGNTLADDEILGFDDVILSGDVAAVPLPASGLLLVGGMALLARRRRNRR